MLERREHKAGEEEKMTVKCVCVVGEGVRT